MRRFLLFFLLLVMLAGNAEAFLPDKCLFRQPFQCDEYMVDVGTDGTDATVMLVITNNGNATTPERLVLLDGSMEVCSILPERSVWNPREDMSFTGTCDITPVTGRNIGYDLIVEFSDGRKVEGELFTRLLLTGALEARVSRREMMQEGIWVIVYYIPFILVSAFAGWGIGTWKGRKWPKKTRADAALIGGIASLVSTLLSTWILGILPAFFVGFTITLLHIAKKNGEKTSRTVRLLVVTTIVLVPLMLLVLAYFSVMRPPPAISLAILLASVT